MMADANDFDDIFNFDDEDILEVRKIRSTTSTTPMLAEESLNGGLQL